MKHLLHLFSLLFIVAVINSKALAQKNLTNSRTSSYYTYIYKLTDKESFAVAAESNAVINDGYMHTLVDSFYTDRGSYKKRLPYGNYLYVSVKESELNYNFVAESNVTLQFINNKNDFQFAISDLKGNPVKNADVIVGKRKSARYDRKANVYSTNAGTKIKVITVKYGGISSYFTYDINENKPYKRPFFKRLFNFKHYFKKRRVQDKPKYAGYMVFNKPIYKPLDTVKFKTYLVAANGNPIRDKLLRLELQKDWNSPGILINTLSPYRDGGYEYSFVLADTLQLKLDRRYTLILKEKVKNDWKTVYSGSFNYEDYELKSVNFSVRTDRETHRPGSPITVFLKATDENELAVADGRVEVTATTQNVVKYSGRQVFVKNNLWKTSLTLDPVGETKLVLPDSIFPNADLNFSMMFDFLNSNNEHRTVGKSLKYIQANRQIKSTFKSDSLQLAYLVNGKPVADKATVYTSYEDSEEEDSVQLKLPATIKLNYAASDYRVKMADGYFDDIFWDDFNPEISVSAAQGKDSLKVLVNNDHKVPFWYTIFSGNEVISRGYTGRLDTLIKCSGTKAAHIRVNYFWDGEEKSSEVSAYYTPQVLNVKLLAPDIVYPGQTVNMKVKVTDQEHQPVASTDVTAYAYTSKFKNAADVSLPYFGKRFFMRKQKGENEVDDLNSSGSMNLNWPKWGKELGLDTITYYQFTQTKDLYAVREKDKIDSTSVAPFVVKDGNIQPLHILYIDGIPVFFNQAEQLQRYVFKIKPGSHSLGLRTTDHMIFVDNFEFEAGKKTIMGIAADLANPKARVQIASDKLTDTESELLTKYMLRIQDNFEGEKTLLITDHTEHLLNPPPSVSRNTDLLVGPFSENYLRIKSGELNQNFIKEPGYNYTFLPGLLKQKSYVDKYGFSTSLHYRNTVASDYKQDLLKAGEIDSIWNEYLDLRSRTTTLFHNSYNNSNEAGKLLMQLDTGIAHRMPYVKNILIYKDLEPDFLRIYPGNSTDFTSLDEGKYRIMYLFKDNRYFTADHVAIRTNGINYFEWNDVKIKPADSLSNSIDRLIKSVKTNRDRYTSFFAGGKITEKLNDTYFDKSTMIYTMRGKVIDASDRSALAGVSVKIKGLSQGIVTGTDGNFVLKVPKKGKLIFSYIGYINKEIEVKDGSIGSVALETSNNALDEVVVVGYGEVSRKELASSKSIVTQALAGRLAGVSIGNTNDQLKILIRGNNSLSADKKPLIIVDGLPFSGELSVIDPNNISSVNIIKDVDATAIYGSRGANGVIIVKTKTGNLTANSLGEPVAQQQTMRTNFSDYAIWQPKLLTDLEGNASFTVKFPDDITNWTTKLIAMNGRKQGGTAETSIKSFKTLSANFVSPQFAIAGDSLKVIGKLMNYSNMEESVLRQFSYNDLELRNNSLKFKNAYIDTVAILAKGFKDSSNIDSLKFEYTMKQDNGYFDGEIRKIPLFQAGVLETKGVFNAFTRDTTVNYTFDASLGKVTLRAEASVFPTLLDEMEKLRKYEYLCNEQLASKLKSLLLEKTVRKYLGDDFNEEKNIRDLLKKLQNNKRPEGTWGWWQNSNEELWISLHVTEALLMAEKQGYPVVLDKTKIYNYLVGKLAGRQAFDQVFAVRLLHLLSDKYYLKDWIVAIEKQKLADAEEHKYKLSVYDKLQIMELRQQAGLAIDLKWLMEVKKQTMFGNIYWGEEGRNFWDNSIQNTLFAYRILKSAGNHKNELDQIQRYFLEQRKDGQWRNTYESSLILETILPELMVTGKKAEPTSLVLNKTEKITTFPFNKVIEPATVSVQKKGDAPVYFTAYQQFNNSTPEKVSKDFSVKTWFDQKGMEVKQLKAGTITTLKVEVDVRADADYVMIEIPIPAGCSYENKPQSYWGVETHREYFKNKTSIFCTKLKQGKYMFTIQLMPRYSGNYILNPAKAEMMYFPIFYGREGMKKVSIN